MSHKALATFAADSITDRLRQLGPETTSGLCRALQCVCDGAGQFLYFFWQVRYSRRSRVNFMGDGEAQPRNVIGRGPVRSSGNIIQPRRARRCNEEWALLVLYHFAHCVVRPRGVRDFLATSKGC